MSIELQQSICFAGAYLIAIITVASMALPIKKIKSDSGNNQKSDVK